MSQHTLHAIQRLFAALRDDRRGSVFAIGAAAIMVFVGIAGIATDSTLGFLVKSRMSKALDAAGLAAGRSALSSDVTTEARAFFDANFRVDYLDAAIIDFAVTPDANVEYITLTASASVPTRFMRVFGINDLAVNARTVVHRQTRGMELVLVMDNTGSMRSGGMMGAMKAAAQDLVNILYSGHETLPNFWVGLVPFVASVNIGAQHSDWLAPTDRLFDAPSPFAPTTWKGCVEARAAPHDQSDATPMTEPFRSYLYPAGVDNIWPPLDETNEAENNGHGPNLGCGPAITPLAAERSTISAAITEMQPWHRGGTAANLGLVWGWRALSPLWRGLWGDIALPLDYNTPLMDKVVVVLTDGQNQFFDWRDHTPNSGIGPGGSDYTAYGRLADFGFATLAAGRAQIDTRFSNICTQMKANGIILYTITFGTTPDTTTQTLYRTCASSPANYFHAPSNAVLSTTFRTIGERLSNLRIAQ